MSRNNHPVIIHIGLHKTATTWLQNIFFIGSNGFFSPFSYFEIADRIVYPSHSELLPSEIQREVAERSRGEEGKVTVLSCERLCGNPHSGSYDRREIATRLKNVFPDARIVITLRNQEDIIVSNYKQYVREGGIGSFAYYTKGDPPERIPTFNLKQFEYDQLAELYFDLFGEKNVCILRMEDLIERPDQFLHELCEFTSSTADINNLLTASSDSSNQSFSEPSLLILRIFNIFSYYPSMGIYPFLRLPGRKNLRRALTLVDDALHLRKRFGSLERKCEKLIGGYYLQSNRRLEALLQKRSQSL